MGGRNPYLALQAGTRSSKSAERFPYTLFDRYELAVGTREIRMFQIASGQNGRTDADTNMNVGGQIANGKKFIWKELKCTLISKTALLPDDLNSIYQMIASTSLQIVVDGKQDIGKYPLSRVFNAPLMAYINSHLATGSGNQFSELNNVSPFCATIKFPIPYVLAALQPFEIKITHHDAIASTLAGMRFYAYLDGVMTSLN